MRLYKYPDLVLAENIRKLMKEKKLSCRQLASVCGKERKSALNWANEVSGPSARDLKRICLAYGLSADEMLGIKRRDTNGEET